METYSNSNKANLHQFAIKNMFEYESNKGIKKSYPNNESFGNLFRWWRIFNFDEVQKESENFEYIHEFYKKNNKTRKIKISLMENNILKNKIHLYLFNNNKKQNIEIELTIDELENVCSKAQNNNIKINLVVFINLKNKYEDMEFININDKKYFQQNFIGKIVLGFENFYKWKQIYTLFYDPYENNIYSGIQNGLKKIIFIQINAENKKIYKYEKNNEIEHIQIL